MAELYEGRPLTEGLTRTRTDCWHDGRLAVVGSAPARSLGEAPAPDRIPQRRKRRPKVRFGANLGLMQRQPAEVASYAAQYDLAEAARFASLDLLTASIAHEVNEPLVAILTNGETRLRSLDRGERARRRTDPRAHQARDCGCAAYPKSSIASASWPNDRNPSACSLRFNEMIEESIVFLRHELRSKDIAISLDFAPRLPRIVGDRKQLEQVIVNLVANAPGAVTHPQI